MTGSGNEPWREPAKATTYGRSEKCKPEGEGTLNVHTSMKWFFHGKALALLFFSVKFVCQFSFFRFLFNGIAPKLLLHLGTDVLGITGMQYNH